MPKTLGARPAPCSKTWTAIKDVTITPGSFYDSATAEGVDCFHFVNYWVIAKSPTNRAMENVEITVMFELPDVGATGLADLCGERSAAERPIPLTANSGPANGGYGSFIVRAPVVGPKTRVIVRNGGTEAMEFTVYGYASQ